jgi:hypothetical protein
MPQHLEAREHVRQLVGARGAEARACPERGVEEGRAEQRRVVMRHRVAEVERDRVPPVFALDGREALSCFAQRLFPNDLAHAGAFAPQRRAHAVGVEPHVVERRRLRTDVPAAERVLAIARDARGPSGTGGDRAQGRRMPSPSWEVRRRMPSPSWDARRSSVGHCPTGS